MAGGEAPVPGQPAGPGADGRWRVRHPRRHRPRSRGGGRGPRWRSRSSRRLVAVGGRQGNPQKGREFFWTSMTASARSRRRWRRAMSWRALANSASSGLAAATFGPRLSGFNASKAPASRCRRQSVRADEDKPSRRRMAAIPPVSAARSVSARMPSFSAAVKVRRFGRDDSSGEAAAGVATTRGFSPISGTTPAPVAGRGVLLGMTTQ